MSIQQISLKTPVIAEFVIVNVNNCQVKKKQPDLF